MNSPSDCRPAVKKFRAFYGSRRFIKVCHLKWVDNIKERHGGCSRLRIVSSGRLRYRRYWNWRLCADGIPWTQHKRTLLLSTHKNDSWPWQRKAPNLCDTVAKKAGRYCQYNMSIAVHQSPCVWCSFYNEPALKFVNSCDQTEHKTK